MTLAREPGGFTVHVAGRYARFCWPWRRGRFKNGSRWFTGWHRQP